MSSSARDAREIAIGMGASRESSSSVARDLEAGAGACDEGGASSALRLAALAAACCVGAWLAAGMPPAPSPSRSPGMLSSSSGTCCSAAAGACPAIGSSGARWCAGACPPTWMPSSPPWSRKSPALSSGTSSSSSSGGSLWSPSATALHATASSPAPVSNRGPRQRWKVATRVRLLAARGARPSFQRPLFTSPHWLVYVPSPSGLPHLHSPS
mmetsp:Transcript_67310/g.189648  ORF Transcript_67310/g.189648 Transcript_67310/m.189648 type:complete len:212 (-) Transcript_67310:1149-1784(-)